MFSISELEYILQFVVGHKEKMSRWYNCLEIAWGMEKTLEFGIKMYCCL